MLYKTDYVTKDNIRGFIHFLKDVYGNTPLRAAEVGVEYGTNAFNMLRSLNIKELFLIDPYSEKQYTCNNQATLDEAREHALKLLEPFNDRIIWVNEPSFEGIKRINTFIDFGYLDNLHDFGYLRNEIPLWYNVVKPNGYLIGHDYVRVGSRENMEVSDAIHEIVAKTGADIYITKDCYADWWLCKDKLDDITLWE